MTDPVKQREMEAKVSQSQQKINEWQEELKHLKGFLKILVKNTVVLPCLVKRELFCDYI